MNKTAHKNLTKKQRIEKFVEYNARLRDTTAAAEQKFMKQLDDLSYAQLRFISVIAVSQPCTMSIIAKRAHLTLGSVTQLVDKLVKKKLVKRIRCEQDRRVVYAELTDKGQRIYDLQEKHVKEICANLLTKVSIKEQEQFLDILLKFVS